MSTYIQTHTLTSISVLHMYMGLGSVTLERLFSPKKKLTLPLLATIDLLHLLLEVNPFETYAQHVVMMWSCGGSHIVES